MSPWRACRSAARMSAALTHCPIRSHADSWRSQPDTERNGMPARRKTLPISGIEHCPQ